MSNIDNSILQQRLVQSDHIGLVLDHLQLTCADLLPGIRRLIITLCDTDGAIKASLEGSIENVLSLDDAEWKQIYPKLCTLAEANPFIAGYMVEKLAALKFWGVLDLFLDFLLEVKNYSARAAGYLVGAKSSKNDDVSDVINAVGVEYYRTLLICTQKHHARLGITSIYIMMHAKNFFPFVSIDEIPDFIEFCNDFTGEHGLNAMISLLKSAGRMMADTSLMHLAERCREAGQHGEDYLCYYMETFVGGVGEISTDISALPSREAFLEMLRAGAMPASILPHPAIFRKPQESALIRSWQELDSGTRRNVLWQLSLPDLGAHLLQHWNNVGILSAVSAIANENWFVSWQYCNGRLDAAGLRQRISDIIKDQLPKEVVLAMVEANRGLFSRGPGSATPERLLAIIGEVMEQTPPDSLSLHLGDIRKFLNGCHAPLRAAMSRQDIYIETWARSPWQDYGRSDELYSCTSMGDYSSRHAPAILVDPNLSNLDIWSNGIRVGRIHLCLVVNEVGVTYLLVDAVEGSERMVQSLSRVKKIVSAIEDYAKFVGVCNVIYNGVVTYNNTPKRFIRRLREDFPLTQLQGVFRRRLVDAAIYSILPNPLRPFLEAFDTRAEGIVTALVIDRSR